MDFKKQCYSILIVSVSKNLATSLVALFPESNYAPIHLVNSISAAKRTMTERTFDFVVINSPLSDEQGTDFAIDICTSKESVVVMLVKSDLEAALKDKVSKFGVYTLPKPTSKQVITQAFSWMESTRERLRRFSKKTTSIEEKMAEIRKVNKAKWILITELKMTEPDAHRYIEKQAMDQCTSKLIIAENIIKTYT